MGDMKEYKRWADMTPEQRKKRKWDEAGQPRIWWSSDQQGLFRREGPKLRKPNA